MSIGAKLGEVRSRECATQICQVGTFPLDVPSLPALHVTKTSPWEEENLNILP